MEGVAEDTVSAPKDLSHIAKGKRTKRYRPHSPIPFTIATHSSVDCDMTCMVNLNNLSPSFTDEKGGGTATEEDKDMANCLILLSQGNPIKVSPNMNLDHDLYTPNYGEKFISKRYIEAPMSLNGKTGMYVYQCKTCGRTFLTFQALGGHRASHKKPKNMAANEAKKISSTLALSDNEDESLKINNYKSKKPPALSLELSNRGGAFDITNKSPLQKIHECSYCGAEFTSGQALGGHMRRHRAGVVVAPATPSTNTTLSLSPIPISAAPATPSTNTTLSLSPIPISPAISLNQSDHDPNGKKKVVPLSLDLKMRNAMSLDLNLPAQLEDEHQIQQKHQQVEPEPALVLSTIRFIQCHY